MTIDWQRAPMPSVATALIRVSETTHTPLLPRLE
jgi:hypothetical protein